MLGKGSENEVLRMARNGGETLPKSWDRIHRIGTNRRPNPWIAARTQEDNCKEMKEVTGY